MLWLLGPSYFQGRIECIHLEAPLRPDASERLHCGYRRFVATCHDKEFVEERLHSALPCANVRSFSPGKRTTEPQTIVFEFQDHLHTLARIQCYAEQALERGGDLRVNLVRPFLLD